MDRLPRREFVRQLLALGIGCLPAAGAARALARDAGRDDTTVTGRTGPGLDAFDVQMPPYMAAWGITNAALAVTYRGRLMLARGYTRQPAAADLTATPTALFRVGSISKPLTASAIFHLVDDGVIDPGDTVADILLERHPGLRFADARWQQVTIAHLLQHLGGWDRGRTFDPMFYDYAIARALQKPLPIDKDDILRFMAAQPLQTDPGTTFSYSNFGYSLLGQVIETVTQQSYEGYVRAHVFKPVGVSRPVIGHSLPAQRRPGEVAYHSDCVTASVFDAGERRVPCQYGGWNVENMDAHGGWIASAVDIARFAAAFDDPGRCPFLSPAAVESMFALPENISPDRYRPGDPYTASGWSVRDYGNGHRNTWHLGIIAGTFGFMARWQSGINAVALFNRFEEGMAQIDGILWKTAHAVKHWPNRDLFDRYL